jgi:diguanylate cyclase (GGDEF)-like protein
MLNVPTLWTAFIVNFFALSLIWAYILHSYPTFEAARFWTASAFASALSAAAALLAIVIGSLAPMVVGATLITFATCLAALGIRRFYDQSTVWRGTVLVTAATLFGLGFFLYGYDSSTLRIVLYSTFQSLPIVASIRWLTKRRGGGPISPGARLAASVAAVILAINAFRVIGKLSQVDGDFSFVHFNASQSIMILALMFLSMVWNFGFLLMAMDRLRNEVADLALMDDLTGVGNRRQLLQRLSEECARSDRSSQPFALLVVDLDNFKTINDTHGHAAGDDCLRHFTLMAQTRLRPGDLLARTGGDEFCILLPASTVREGAVIARRIVDVCREDAAGCVGDEVPLSVSIGVAQWSRDIGSFPDRLIAAADHALYVAKKEGRDRFSVYEPAPSLVPPMEPIPQALRRHA